MLRHDGANLLIQFKDGKFFNDSKPTFTVFVIEIQCSCKMFVNNVRNVTGVMCNDDAGG